MNFKMHNNIFFSCKANKGFSFLKTAADEQCGIEVSSLYELRDALKYTHKIISSGPAKDDDYLKLAIAFL
jgi:diaminopimelate decarboxylase